MIRIALYARYSSENQRDASIEDQLRQCRERAEREGWTVVETYSDRAISGSSMFRAGIRSLLADAQAGRFDIREHLPGGKNRPGKPGKQQEEDNPPAHRDPAI